MRRWSLLEVYALLVCLGMLVWFIIALYLLGLGLVSVEIPKFTVNGWTYAQHQTNDAFWDHYVRFRSSPPSRPSEEALTAEREQSWCAVLEAERRNGLQRVAWSMFGLVVSSVTFWVHWRVARRARIEDRDWVPPTERFANMDPSYKAETTDPARVLPTGDS
jgi:hypothetical protein